MDSNDRDRVVEARDELHRMLNEVSCIVLGAQQQARKLTEGLLLTSHVF